MTILHDGVLPFPPTQFTSAVCICLKGMACPKSNYSLSIHEETLPQSPMTQGHQIPASTPLANLK